MDRVAKRGRSDLLEKVAAGKMTPLVADRKAKAEPGPSPALERSNFAEPRRPELSAWPDAVERLHQELLEIERRLETAEEGDLETLALEERRITNR